MRTRVGWIVLFACAALLIFGGPVQAQTQTLDSTWMKTTNQFSGIVRGYPYIPVTDGYWQWTSTVWDGLQQNDATPPITIPNWVSGDFWAKWNYQGSFPAHVQQWFKTTLNMPACTDSPLTEVLLVNKYNPESGPILSINDGIYVWVNGVMARAGGNGRLGYYTGDTLPAWASMYTPSIRMPGYAAAETDYQLIPGGLPLPPSLFQVGDNQIHVLTDDIAAWGGLGHPVFKVTCMKTVQIDIKPGSYPNSFNLNSNGVIPVAIFGSGTFDVGQVNQNSLSFNGLAVRVKGNGAPQCSVQNVNADAYSDLVCQFTDDTTLWVAGTATATLRGTLNNGTPFAGSDEINIVP